MKLLYIFNSIFLNFSDNCSVFIPTLDKKSFDFNLILVALKTNIFKFKYPNENKLRKDLVTNRRLIFVSKPRLSPYLVQAVRDTRRRLSRSLSQGNALDNKN